MWMQKNHFTDYYSAELYLFICLFCAPVMLIRIKKKSVATHLDLEVEDRYNIQEMSEKDQLGFIVC